MSISRRRYRQVVLRGSLFVLLFVLAPNVMYLGHWDTGSAAAGHTHGAGQTQGSGHAEHCHEGPSQCDHPATVSVSWVTGESRESQFEDASLFAVPHDEGVNDVEAPAEVITPPPRPFV